MNACPRCKASLETPLACSACGALVPPGSDATPFAILGLESGFAVDPAELKRRLLRFSRLVHPDFFATAGPDALAAAERASAALNAAHEIVADEFSRADWLVKSLGGPDEQAERAMPQAFLMEVLDWNEALEAARAAAPGSAERAAVARLATDLEARRRELFANLARRLTPLPARGAPELTAARKELNAVRYLEKTLSEIDALRVAQSLSR